jgi:hypothetical protein
MAGQPLPKTRSDAEQKTKPSTANVSADCPISNPGMTGIQLYGQKVDPTSLGMVDITWQQRIDPKGGALHAMREYHS